MGELRHIVGEINQHRLLVECLLAPLVEILLADVVGQVLQHDRVLVAGDELLLQVGHVAPDLGLDAQHAGEYHEGGHRIDDVGGIGALLGRYL